MFGKLVVFVCATALVSAGYSGPPHYGYDVSGSYKADSYKSVGQEGTFGPIASNSGFKEYSGPTIAPIPTPVPGVFTATTKNGNPVSEPSYPPLQYSKTKTKSVSLSYNNPSVAYPTQYAGVTDYPASYSAQNYAQIPQGYPQPQAYQVVQQVYPQAYQQAVAQAVPQTVSQTVPQAAHQAYVYQPSQVSLPGYQAYSAPSQYQGYSAPTQYQAYHAPQYQASQYQASHYQAPQYQATQYQAYQAPQYQAYSAPAQYQGYPAGYPSVQYSSPVQYSSAPAVSHVQYSGNDGSYSWRRK